MVTLLQHNYSNINYVLVYNIQNYSRKNSCAKLVLCLALTHLLVCPRTLAGSGHWPHIGFQPWPWIGSPGWVLDPLWSSWCHWFHWSVETSLEHGAPVKFTSTVKLYFISLHLVEINSWIIARNQQMSIPLLKLNASIENKTSLLI